MKIRPLFAWYDLWVGAFVDRKGWKLYLFPVPMFGVVIEFAPHRGGGADRAGEAGDG